MHRLLAAAVAATTVTAMAHGQVADLRVVHASPDAPNVDVYVNGGLAFENLPFNEATVYASLLPDTYNIQVAPTGTQTFVIDVDLPVDADTDYTVVAVNEVASIAPFVLVDDNTIDADNARVRFFHASPDAPEVDIVVANGGPVLFDDIEYLETGDYLTVAPGVYDLEVQVSSSGAVVLELPGVEFSAGTVYTVFATGFAGGGDPALGVLLTVDNSNSGVNVSLPLGATAGAPNLIRVNGATPGDRVGAAWSFSTGMTMIPGCNVSLDLARATPVGIERADNLGEANFVRFVPGVVGGRTLFLQAANLSTCETSDVITAEF